MWVGSARFRWLAIFAVLFSQVSLIHESAANNCSVTYGTVSGSVRFAQITTGAGCAWIIPAGVSNLTYLVVGGGGGGGGARRANLSPNLGAGGGGSGGQVRSSSISVVAGNSISITVGTGGAGGAASVDGSNGSNSSISYLSTTVTAVAGSAGKGSNGSHDSANLSGDGGSNTVFGGFAGGFNNWDGGGGGAGSGGVGVNGTDIAGQGGNGGAGGIGTSSSIRGSAQFFGGGGGGGGTPSTNSNETNGSGGAGGSGVGGSGGGRAGIMPTVGTSNTGSGGGGGGWRYTNTDTQRAGAAGSNGIIVFSYSKASASILSSSITSNAGSDRTYSLGETINVTVVFTETVTVSGTPLIPIVGLTSRNLSYSSGNGTNSLVFTYTVQSSDLNLSGISILANSLSLNAGSIIDTGGLLATITHTSISASSNHLVDGVVPTISTSAPISIAENSFSVTTLAASESVIWEISGGTDAAFFTLETATGILNISSRDFESPQDGGFNNVYEVNIRASDLAGNFSVSRTFFITITNVPEIANIGVPSLVGPASKGVTISISITVDVPGKVRFLANGKRINKCKALSTTGIAPTLSTNCSWKPSTVGRVVITAILTPTSGQYLKVTSQPLNTFVSRRTNTRSS